MRGPYDGRVLMTGEFATFPTLPSIVGHTSPRHPNIAALERKARSVLGKLEALAGTVADVRYDPDTNAHEGHLEVWEQTLGGCLRLRSELESEGAARFHRDVRRFLPHLSGPLDDAWRGALDVLVELEAFIRDAALGQGEPNLLLEVEPGAPGPTEDFEF